MPTRPAMPAAVTPSPSSRPPFPWLADYRCQSADAELPPVRLPNPCRLRRHPLSGELPASRPVSPVIVLPLWMLMLLLEVVVIAAETTRSTSAVVVLFLLELLVYMEICGKTYNATVLLLILLLGILRLLIIPAFGEILPLWYAKVGARPPLSTVTTAWTVSAAAGRAGKRSDAASMPASRHRSIAGVIWLLYAGRAVKEEPQAAGAADKGIWYARQSRQKPPQTRIRLAPIPEGK